ncbi:phosphoglycerate mutase [Saccharothrix saharensis]|uniref:2,3-bisphosphoglycerate-independent phosphoglycerate mutase n=1 Tax=Saccharothrix saharensis TaxID=571190 RepID=A0A543J9C8_9PSEU|nr:2,3-bisphosphoglycerate-independent phosphoglycerate mutase [Saccharothrix saharensis]TQM79394.1 phosphoglycerate mutase [Saccharothrix saharensis]
MSDRHNGILLILDGWGHAPPAPGNAISAAVTPALDDLLTRYPTALLPASGTAVGLPDGVVGNSEIGHMVIGAGRPLEYDSLLVQRQVDSGELRRHPDLVAACTRLAANGGALHLVGLCSDGRIHADVAHVAELLHAAADAGLRQVFLHAITDGRDVADGSAGQHLDVLLGHADRAGAGRCVSVVGRNFAMDKSGKADLTAIACSLIVDAEAERVVPEPRAAVDGQAGDQWIPATVVSGDGSRHPVRDGDVVLFTNFRSDRISPLVDMVHTRLRDTGRSSVRLLSLAQYDTTAEVVPLVRRADASGGLADALEAAGVRSVRIAEREKFEHVTFYVNGRDPSARPFEEHQLVPTAVGDDYVAQPRMNVAEVARRVVEAAERDDVGVVVANLANIDVVGHTGDYEATVVATGAVDTAVATICAAARARGRWVLLVGDHGNAEQMVKTGNTGEQRPYGGHTHNPVPCVLVPAPESAYALDPRVTGAALPSVGPTVLQLLGLPVPPTMTAPRLLTEAAEPHRRPVRAAPTTN